MDVSTTRKNWWRSEDAVSACVFSTHPPVGWLGYQHKWKQQQGHSQCCRTSQLSWVERMISRGERLVQRFSMWSGRKVRSGKVYSLRSEDSHFSTFKLFTSVPIYISICFESAPVVHFSCALHTSIIYLVHRLRYTLWMSASHREIYLNIVNHTKWKKKL